MDAASMRSARLVNREQPVVFGGFQASIRSARADSAGGQDDDGALVRPLSHIDRGRLRVWLTNKGTPYGVQVTWYWSLAMPLPPQIRGEHRPLEQDGRPEVTFGNEGWFNWLQSGLSTPSPLTPFVPEQLVYPALDTMCQASPKVPTMTTSPLGSAAVTLQLGLLGSVIVTV
jgi:hypothetical protein